LPDVQRISPQSPAHAIAREQRKVAKRQIRARPAWQGSGKDHPIMRLAHRHGSEARRKVVLLDFR